jgi:hypothetical protein
MDALIILTFNKLAGLVYITLGSNIFKLKLILTKIAFQIYLVRFHYN